MKVAKLLGMLALGMTLWAADPAIGTWKLNVAKSDTPGPTPKAPRLPTKKPPTASNGPAKASMRTERRRPFEYTAKFDGKDYPVTGSDLYDAITLKRINDQTAEGTLKKSGKVVSHARRVVSKDGK